MKNKKSLLFLSLLIATIIVAVVSCKKDVSIENGSTPGPVPAGKAEMKIMLTDDPSVIFDSIFIDIQRVEVKVEDSTGAEHWDTLSIRAGVYNILNFRNG